jgi:hypothetical protein
MWLINTTTVTLEENLESQARPYAILSHVWGPEEVSFIDIRKDPRVCRDKAGFQKIINCCAIAKTLGFEYAWVDTCCIDKSSSADLSEAINSMYRYYRDASVCLIYLADVAKQQAHPNVLSRAEILGTIRSSRWFTRGWTLQELVASSNRRFFASDWSLLEDGHDLLELISEVTNVKLDLLMHERPISSYCIAERMSWAAKRQTTRDEDSAYSLMGIFNVNMPILYGEGSRSAFQRLQKEIIQTSFDQTIFAWRGNYESSGLLAHSPSDFADVPPLGLWAPNRLEPYSMTNLGLSISMNMVHETEGKDTEGSGDKQNQHVLTALQCDVKAGDTWKVLMIYLQRTSGVTAYVHGQRINAYRRVNCGEWIAADGCILSGWPYEHVVVLEDEQYQLLLNATEEHNLRWGDESAPGKAHALVKIA